MPFIALAATLIPQLIQAGMAIEPVLEKLFNMKGEPTEADFDFLHQMQAQALAVINDTTRDVR